MIYDLCCNIATVTNIALLDVVMFYNALQVYIIHCNSL